MPLVSKMVSIDGKKYLDGAIGDSIPVKWAQDMGYDKIIVVETRPKDYQKKKSLRFPYFLRYFKYPLFVIAAIFQNKTGSGIPRIVLKNFKELTIPCPCLEEQRLIADFLSDFDEAIAAAKKELELWKELKKGLLQKMFV